MGLVLRPTALPGRLTWDAWYTRNHAEALRRAKELLWKAGIIFDEAQVKSYVRMSLPTRAAAYDDRPWRVIRRAETRKRRQKGERAASTCAASVGRR